MRVPEPGFNDFRWFQSTSGGTIFTTFQYNMWILSKMVEPRFCETLQCFHHILGDATLPEGTEKQKMTPSEIRFILDMTKTSPTLIFQCFMSNSGTILGNISQIIQVSVSSTQKYTKDKSHSLSRQGYPGCITEEGGTGRPWQGGPQVIWEVGAM